MKRLLLATALALGIAAPALADTITSIGRGNDSCGSWIQARNTDYYGAALQDGQ
jgi:hypothetical protein